MNFANNVRVTHVKVGVGGKPSEALRKERATGGEPQKEGVRAPLTRGSSGRNVLAADDYCSIQPLHPGVVFTADLTNAEQEAVIDLSMEPPAVCKETKSLWQNMFCGGLRPCAS